MKYPFLFFTAVNGFVVVALGAFGAHALEDRINVAMLEVYDTAVQYQMFHTLAFVAIHVLARESLQRPLVDQALQDLQAGARRRRTCLGSARRRVG